jgi:hypothetical protein
MRNVSFFFGGSGAIVTAVEIVKMRLATVNSHAGYIFLRPSVSLKKGSDAKE